MTADWDAPLEDPDYEPEHPPVNGQIPDVVARFGPRPQVRWFRRFGKELGKRSDWDEHDYHYTSEHHTGFCCGSCAGEYEDGYQGGGVMADGWCCCRDPRIPRRTTS